MRRSITRPAVCAPVTTARLNLLCNVLDFGGNTMDLNITEFFNSANAFDYSSSIAERGQNAGRETWHNACNADFLILDNEEKQEAFKDFVRGFGAWSDEEIAAWSVTELNALCIQFISGDIREFEDLAGGDWQQWQELCEADTCNGRMYGGPLSTDGQVYFSIGG